MSEAEISQCYIMVTVIMAYRQAVFVGNGFYIQSGKKQLNRQCITKLLQC